MLFVNGSGGFSKGTVLREFIENLFKKEVGNIPKIIIMVDDNPRYITEVGEAVKRFYLNVKLTLIFHGLSQAE